MSVQESSVSCSFHTSHAQHEAKHTGFWVSYAKLKPNMSLTHTHTHTHTAGPSWAPTREVWEGGWEGGYHHTVL